MDRGWVSVGEVLGSAVELHAIALVLGLLGGHHAAFVIYWFTEDPSLRRPIEWFYGFINPLMYLLAFRPRFLDVTPLLAVQFAAFALYWATRWAALPGTSSALWRVRAARFAGVVIVLTSVRDFVAFAVPMGDGRPLDTEGFASAAIFVVPFMFGPLYAIPLFTAREVIDSGGAIQRRGRLPRAVAPVALALFYATAILGAGLWWRPSEEDARHLVVRHSSAIRLAAREHDLHPRVLGAILYVTHSEHVSSTGRALEAVSAGLFARDERDSWGAMKTANLSVGLMQVKPVTALTALSAQHNAGTEKPWPPNKGGRGVEVRSDWFKRLAVSQLQRVPPPMPPRTTRRAELVAALVDPEQSVRFAAFILNLYATQWEAAAPAWSIRHRPEILATLYQIGFERSVPKPDPRPNDFGESVLDAYDSDWLRALFPDEAATSPSAR